MPPKQIKHKGRVISKQIEIAAPPEAVWKALTDPEELKRWFPLDARVKPGPGGEIFLSWGPGCEGAAPIKIWKANKELCWVESSSEQPHIIDWTLAAHGGKTTVRLVNSGFTSDSEWDKEWHDSTDYGWGFMLTSLRHYLERHAGSPRCVAWPRRKVEMPRAEIFERLTAPGALFVDGTRALATVAAPYSVMAVTGEELHGRVEIYEPPRGWCVTVADWNDALFWLTIEGASGAHEVQLWISTFNIPQASVEALRDRWTQVLENLFPASA
jgi:uncharacterized protein YndB with AHSA1/START domain